MINWQYTLTTVPEPNRELIAKDSSKVFERGSAGKQCRVIKFHRDFNEHQIKDALLSDNFMQWAYTE